MDTPGILVPKIATPEAQWQLALTGALPRERFDAEEVVARVRRVGARARAGARRVPTSRRSPARAASRGAAASSTCTTRPARTSRTSATAKFGRITFERPEPA